MIRWLLSLSLIASTACATSQPPALPAPASTTPSLVVVLVIDQMRTDYIDRGLPHFTGGLRRLASEGAWFRSAAYPYLNTITCAGHSTIGTGSLPYRHGMVLNAWWDRKAGRSMPCTSDSTVRNIGYTGKPAGGDSPRSLLAATLAETIRDQSGGRTLAFSLKPRSTIPVVGRGATAVVWFDDQAGWTTSTAYTPKTLPWLDRYFSGHPIAADAGRTWERTLSPSEYQGEDDGAGERSPQGWTRTFPHVLAKTVSPFTAQWQRSPFADEYLGRLAANAISELELGRGKGIDFMSVSFSSLDLVGHLFGPASHEVQDVVLRLDRTIGALLDHLDKTVGRGRYVVALSADHGVGSLPEQSQNGGRQGGPEALAAINDALVPFFGEGKYAVHSAYTDLYLAPGVGQKLEANPKAASAVLAALKALPAVAYAFFASEIAGADARTSSDPVRRAAALNYHPERSGDIIIAPKPGWMLSTTSAATHGTFYAHDQKVPVIFYGAGVPPGTRDDPATPADIAPTLGALVGVSFVTPDGRVLLHAGR